MSALRKERSNALVERILSRKAEVRALLWKELEAERDERRARGEVLARGVWVPKELVPRIEQSFSQRARKILVELHIAAAVILTVDFIVWSVFRKFLLP